MSMRPLSQAAKICWNGPKYSLIISKKTEECLRHFPDYLNKDVFEPYVNEVVKLEEASDEKYIELVHKLYLKEKDSIKIHKDEALYEMLENVSD